MCHTISIIRNRFPEALIAQHNLDARAHQRNPDGVVEIVFNFANRKHPAQLPVEHQGQLCIYEWGNRSGNSRLPKDGWCSQESLEAGKFAMLAPEPVIIPAQLGEVKGIWFSITEGIRGIVVLDQSEKPHVYILTIPASTYFQNMTRHERMPLLVGEQI